MDVSSHTPTDGGRSSERYQRNAGVLHDCIADVRAVSSDDSEHTVEAILFQNVSHDSSQSNSDKRSCEGSFPHNLVSTDKSDASVPAHNSAREIEGSDHTHVANGIPDFHHKVAWSLTVQDFTVDCA